jgi:hypothetical protein
MQVALELILGFDETLLTEATIRNCTVAFQDWNEGLFSFPINLPWTGAPAGSSQKSHEHPATCGSCISISSTPCMLSSSSMSAAFGRGLKAKSILVGYLKQNLDLLKDRKSR